MCNCIIEKDVETLPICFKEIQEILLFKPLPFSEFVKGSDLTVLE